MGSSAFSAGSSAGGTGLKRGKICIIGGQETTGQLYTGLSISSGKYCSCQQTAYKVALSKSSMGQDRASN